MQLQKCNIVGEVYFHVFVMDDGTRKEIETTEDDYKQLAGVNPNNPTIDGGRWDFSYSNHKYDTPSGTLEDGFYADDNGYKLIKLAGCAQFTSHPENVDETGLVADSLIPVIAEYSSSVLQQPVSVDTIQSLNQTLIP